MISINKMKKEKKLKIGKKCQFCYSCELYYLESFTCSNGGGENCGKYRNLIIEKKKQKHKQTYYNSFCQIDIRKD